MNNQLPIIFGSRLLYMIYLSVQLRYELFRKTGNLSARSHVLSKAVVPSWILATIFLINRCIQKFEKISC